MRIRTSLFGLLFIVACVSRAAAFDSLIDQYRGIFIGSTQDEVHAKLGDPKESIGNEESYQFKDDENARVFFTEDKKVRAIVITYGGKVMPKATEVIGEAIEPREDGGMYKLVRLEEKGFWVSYVKIPGDAPSVIVTVQAIPKAS